MAFAVSESISITVSAGGAATAYTTKLYSGNLLAIVYTPDGTAPYSNSFTVAVTGETSTVAIWSETVATGNAAATRYPRAATHTVLGAAALYAAGGVAVLDYIPLAGERIKVVIGSAGNATVGSFRFIIGP